MLIVSICIIPSTASHEFFHEELKWIRLTIMAYTCKVFPCPSVGIFCDTKKFETAYIFVNSHISILAIMS